MPLPPLASARRAPEPAWHGRVAAGRGRSRAVGAAALAAAALLFGAKTADADVVYAQLFDGPSPLAPVLFAPDGQRRRLAPVAYHRGAGVPRAIGTAFSPDGTLLAVAAASGVALVPTDGGPARALRAVDATTGAETSVDPRLRPPSRAPRLYDADATPVVAWNARGTSFTSGAVPDDRGRLVVRHCVVATGTCRVTGARLLVPVSSLADGRLVLAPRLSGPLSRTVDALGMAELAWRPRSAAWVRRMRRLLERPRFDGLRIQAGAGAPAKVAWGGRVPATQRITSVREIVPGGAESGAVIERTTIRLALRTRHRAGRLEATVQLADDGGPDYVRVTADGRARLLPRLRAGVQPTVGLPGGGWFGVLARSESQAVPARIDASGRATTMRLAGREVTPRVLHDALGLPDAPAPPDDGFDDDPPLPIVEAIGVEAATNSAIVGFDEAPGRYVVARLPFDGGRPTVIDQQEQEGGRSYRSH